MSKHLKKLLTVLLAFTSIAYAQDKPLLLQPGAIDYIGIYDLRAEEPNLTGSQVNITMISRSITYNNEMPQNDFAVNTDHPCFYNSNIAQLSQKDLQTSTSPHATAIAGILVGDNKASFYPQIGDFYYEGAAPDANLNVYEFWYFLKKRLFSNQPLNSDIISISSGSTYQDWWTRGFDSITQKGTTVIAGIGNGTKAKDPVLYPGANPNTIGVGVADCVIDPNITIMLSNFGLAKTENSSFGPAAKNRCKPDIIAPGNCLVPDTNDGYLLSGNYSSFATPLVAGTAALLNQKIKQDHNDINPINTPILIKSILLNSADKMPYWHKGYPETSDDHTAPLDYIQGAGMIDAYGAVQTLDFQNINKTGWQLAAIEPNTTSQIKLSLNDHENKYLTATVVFNYKYHHAYPYDIISEPNLTLQLWAADASEPNKEILIDYSDAKTGTVEHIHTKLPTDYKNYILTVKNTSSDTELVNFALTWQIEKPSNFSKILFYDLNNDGIVNNIDFLRLINNIGKKTQTKKGYRLGDLNANGLIDPNDLKILLRQKNRKAAWKN